MLSFHFNILMGGHSMIGVPLFGKIVVDLVAWVLWMWDG